MSRLSPSLWGLEFVLLAALWGASFLFMRLGAAEFGPLPTAGLRVLLATVFLWPVMVWRGQWPALRRHWRAIALIGLINSALPFALYAWAVMSINTGLAAILNATSPLCGALIAWVWLGQRPDRLRSLGLLIGFGGVLLLAGDQASFKPGGSGLAVLACLGATLCYGWAANLTRRHLAGVPALALACGSQLGSAVALLAPTLMYWPSQTPGPQAWAAVAAIAVLCTGIAYILYFRLIEHAGPAKALTVTFVTPLFAVAYGGLFLGEALTVRMLVCGLVIVCGTALSTGLIRMRPQLDTN
ncbi:MAG: EamA family transporter [Curvibacter sp.]|nr:EamA family transporter [Curvibacter sp.]